ncbi:MAG: UDP-3-O-[3-hydroxymyristoyl] N-acetylglucosamine deacetylase [Planctomycetes bacterium]|nr:UDP-3-O-[3-hydroxymyristoyl] N-acetylglucosamine deacetylase [Planctomycetota bacterium]
MRNQRTIRQSVSLSGRGIHSGHDVTMKLEPAESDFGIVFQRVDLPGKPRVPADHRHAVQRQRQTVLYADGAEVQTIEHFMSAAAGLQIDNLLVSLDGPELPAVDGSAAEFVRILDEAEAVEQKRPRKCFALDRTVVVEHEDSYIVAFPSQDGLKVSYTLDYPVGSHLPSQHVSFVVDPSTYRDQVAQARTFCLESEARALREAGFGQGADYDNTLVVGKDGVIKNELRFDDEFARHKVMDLVGDLGLLGADLSAHVVATKTGHATNVKLVRELRRRLEELENLGLVQRETGLDIKEILKIIPHRYPFLFLDRVISIEGFQRAVAVKNVSFNEPQFQGHWPGQPIFPGVLQVEALAQLAGVLLLRRMDNTGKIAVLLSIDKIKFRRAVVPGDQLRLECETLNARKNSAKVVGRGTVGGDLTVEAVLKFIMMDE